MLIVAPRTLPWSACSSDWAGARSISSALTVDPAVVAVERERDDVFPETTISPSV